MEDQTMHRFKTFLSGTKGSVTHVFAIALLPIIGVAGLGADYARAVQARVTLQSALDSTVLMLTREAPKKDATALQKLADPYFGALMVQYPELATAGLTVGKTDKNVSLSASATVPTFFGGIYAWIAQASGYGSWTINAATEAAYGTKKIELVLVLDNTGSMASANKIQELKKASHTLLDTLETSAVNADQIKVSIVPYTTRVNLGTSYKNEAWLTTAPTGSFTGGYVIPAMRSSWQGCVADRDTGYNTSTMPMSIPVPKSLYPMTNCADGLVEAMPLTSNWSQLHTRITSMKASGMTNITLGAQWGYEMLSGEQPFAQHDPAENVERFMVLLTDGDNTQDRWGSSYAKMNTDTKAMCDAIVERGVAESAKKLKIKLYTVLVIAGNEPLLQSCASAPSMYKKVNQASELEAVFKKIAEDIGQIRLTM
jgi:Flp pilus assembly protein TadG